MRILMIDENSSISLVNNNCNNYSSHYRYMERAGCYLVNEFRQDLITFRTYSWSCWFCNNRKITRECLKEKFDNPSLPFGWKRVMIREGKCDCAFHYLLCP